MNDLQIFNSNEFGQVRTLEIEGKIYFVGKDIASALDYKEPHKAISRHCKSSIKHPIPTKGGKQEMLVIPEDDVYRLVSNSKILNYDIKEYFLNWLISENLIENKEIIFSRNEIEFKYNLLNLFKIAKRIVSAYTTKENVDIIMEIIPQYEVLDYRIDFYLPFFHIAIEYDEYEHKHRKEYDIKREKDIKKYFDDNNDYIEFIRINEGFEDEAIGELIGHLINFSL